MTAFVVEVDRPGFSIGGYEHKLGIKDSPTGSLALEDVRVPGENVIGVGRGMRVALGTLERTRLGAAAQAVGLAQGATDYAKQRIAFDKPIIDLQAIQSSSRTCRSVRPPACELLYKACTLADASPVLADLGMWTPMAKVFASDNAMKVTVDAVEVLSGYGYVSDYPRRADAARRQDHPDLRGHQRDPEARHRPPPSHLTRGPTPDHPGS